MAVTSRDLHRQPLRVAEQPRALPSFTGRISREHMQLGLWIIGGVIILNILLARGELWLNDLRYGRPRTMQVSDYVGHNERPGQPSHFIAMNLNRRVVVIELPGGDSAKARTLQGPYLFGANEDLTPVLLSIRDVNGDAKSDLVIDVKQEQIMYINTGDTFRLINDDERQKLMTQP